MNKEKIEIENKKDAVDTNQTFLDLEKKLDEGFKALVVDVFEMTNHDFFGTDSGTYDEREGYAVTVKIDSPNGDTFKEFFGKPDVRGLKQSNIYAFKRKYGSYPKKGVAVLVHLDENGFFRVTK